MSISLVESLDDITFTDSGSGYEEGQNSSSLTNLHSCLQIPEVPHQLSSAATASTARFVSNTNEIVSMPN